LESNGNEVILSLITRSLTRGLLVHFGWMWNVHSIRLLNTIEPSLYASGEGQESYCQHYTTLVLHTYTTSTTAKASHN